MIDRLARGRKEGKKESLAPVQTNKIDEGTNEPRGYSNVTVIALIVVIVALLSCPSSIVAC